MSRKIKTEVLEYGDKKISFLDFVRNCYNRTEKKITFDFYMIKNKRLLKAQWDVLILTLKKEAIEEIKKNKPE